MKWVDSGAAKFGYEDEKADIRLNEGKGWIVGQTIAYYLVISFIAAATI